VGERRKELIANLRQALNKPVPRSKGQDRRGHIPDQPVILPEMGWVQK
jgi:hypothetical protein